MLNPLLEKSLQGLELSEDEVTSVFAKMLSGTMPPAEIAAYLTAWKRFPEYQNLLVGGARFLKANATKISVGEANRPLFDNCGTGGSGKRKFNTSTAAAIVAASCGVRIAKHGNRGMSGRCGSADFLAALGFPLDLSEARVLKLLEDTGFTFFFAPQFHSVMKHVSEVRKSLATRTIFNLLGPLANPISPDGQLIGVSDSKLIAPMAQALSALGVKRALVVHATSGLDEISAEHSTFACEVKGVDLRSYEIEPKDLGIHAREEELQTGTADECVAVFKGMLEGEVSPHSEGVVINAAHLLLLAQKSEHINDAVQAVRKNISSGSSKDFFSKWLQQAKG